MTGIGEAFLNIQPPKNDGLASSAQGLTQIFATQRENNAARAEREKVRKDNDIKEWQKDNKLNFDDFQQKVSGFNTFDDVGRDFTNQAVDKYIEYNNLADKAMKKGDTATQRLYENKMMKLKGSSAQVKDMVGQFATLHKQYQDMVDKGQMSGVDFDTWEAENYAVNAKKFTVTFDDNDNPVVQGVKTLNNGDAEPFTIPYDKMMNGNWRPYQKTDLLGKDGIVTSVLGSLGSYEKKTEKGLMTIKSKLWTPELQQGAVIRLLPLVKSDEVMADLTNQFDPTSKKRSGFSDEERTNMANNLAEMVKTGYKELYTEEFNKDLAAHQRDLSKIDETKRHNKAVEANTAFSNQTSRQNSNAYVRKLMADAKRDANNDFSLEVSDEFKSKIPNGQYYNFNTYTLGDNKKGQIQPFVLPGRKNAAGEAVMITAPSVDISTDSNIMKLRDSEGMEHVITRKGRFANVFRSIESQMKNRKSDADPTDVAPVTQSPNSPRSPTSLSKGASVQDVKNQFGISY